MTKLPKGPLKVIHISRRAIGENETRTRASAGKARRLIPVVSIATKTGRHEGFGLRIKGEVRLRYDVLKFLASQEYGTPDIRCWLETNDAVEIAESPGELDAHPNSETESHD